MKPPGDCVLYLGIKRCNSQSPRVSLVSWSVGPFVAAFASSSSIMERQESSGLKRTGGKRAIIMAGSLDEIQRSQSNSHIARMNLLMASL